jgi:hypothetical protein
MRVPGIANLPSRRPGTLPAAVALAIVAILVAACGSSGSTPGAGGSPGGDNNGDSGPSPATGLLPGDTPDVTPGPDLGEAWTTEPDPDGFIATEDGTMVAVDQFLVMLDPSATQADAETVAASVDGEIGGYIEYLNIWKIIVWPNYHSGIILDRLRTLEAQPGVLAASTVGLVTVQGDPDCASGLSDPAYAGNLSAPYDMIHVKDAWQAFFASGLPVDSVHVGFLDTELTRDPTGKINWEFDDLTFVGEPSTSTTPGAFDGKTHADGTAGTFAGDGQDGDQVGIASPMGSRVLFSHDVLNGPATKGQPSSWTASDGVTYTDDALLKTLRQIKSGATIINGSWGGSSVTPSNAGAAKMWKAFFTKMAAEHPDVLFVYAAGNYNSALDGTNYFPGGIAAPNVITVGNVDNDGGRHAGTNGSNGVLTGSTGEVTLGAPGDQAVWGTGLSGRVIHGGGGTSSATPMVSAAATLIRSIDPSLKAAEIKKLIAETADQGDPEVGGKTLRIDKALRKAIDKVRKDYGLAPLTDAEIAARTAFCQIDVSASLQEQLTEPAGASRWNVTASIDSALRPGRLVDLSLALNTLRPTDWSKSTTAGGTPVVWSVVVATGGAWVIVTRHDNGYWVKRRLSAGATPTPEPTPEPTLEPTPAASSGYDCSNPPPKGSIEYVQWSLHCKPIGG